MPDLILRRSGRPNGKKWALQLRYHDCLGPTQYETICLVDREMAEDIIEAGKAYWLHGEPGPEPDDERAPSANAAAFA